MEAGIDLGGKDGICKCCISNRKSAGLEGTSKFSQANNMDPGPWPRIYPTSPQLLPQLSFIEQQLIALVHPIVSVYRVAGGQWKGSQVNCISFFQDCTEVFNMVPCMPSDLKVVVVKKKSGNINIHKEFRVDIVRLKIWIHFLMKNKMWYQSRVTMNSSAIQALERFGDDLQRQFEIELDDLPAIEDVEGNLAMCDDERQQLREEWGFVHLPFDPAH